MPAFILEMQGIHQEVQINFIIMKNKLYTLFISIFKNDNVNFVFEFPHSMFEIRKHKLYWNKKSSSLIKIYW